MERRARAVVFDLGGVLVDWNPRHLYRRHFGADEAAMERFLSTVCTQAWNEEQDAGRPFAEGVALLQRAHPEHAELIARYDTDWEQMLRGAHEDTLALLAELKAQATPLYALSNWSMEKFPVALARFEFLSWFDGLVISGAVGMKKPDARIFHHLLDTYGLEPATTVFIDDSAPNVEAAAALGLIALHFTGASRLRQQLAQLGLVR